MSAKTGLIPSRNDLSLNEWLTISEKATPFMGFDLDLVDFLSESLPTTNDISGNEPCLLSVKLSEDACLLIGSSLDKAFTFSS